jgi:opacity protein-like surface antigen
MANFDLDFHPIKQKVTPFIQGGVGGARTVVSYNSAPIPPIDSPNFILPKEASWHFAYQAGAGIKSVVQPHVVVSLRYLYANMGKVNSSTLGSTTTLATPLTVNMSTQNFLFGLTYLIE